MGLEDIEAMNDCASEAQQQFNRPTDISSYSKGIASQRGQMLLSAEAVKESLLSKAAIQETDT
jgi:hypothetical protein